MHASFLQATLRGVCYCVPDLHRHRMIKSLAQGNRGTKAEPRHWIQSLHPQPPCHTAFQPAAQEANFSLGSPNSRPQDKDLNTSDLCGKWSQEALVGA